MTTETNYAEAAGHHKRLALRRRARAAIRRAVTNLYNRFIYRHLMRFMHRHNWHHMEVCNPDGDTMHWCHWCGLRVVTRRHTVPALPEGS